MRRVVAVAAHTGRIRRDDRTAAPQAAAGRIGRTFTVLTRRHPGPYDVARPRIAAFSSSPVAIVVGSFPATRHSVVADIASPDLRLRRVAFDALVSAYWRPVYKYVRIKWRQDRDDAADLTQEFFSRAFERGLLARFDPARARFRTFLRVCLDGFVANEIKAQGRLKRGGGASFVPLDFAAAEQELSTYPAGQAENGAVVANGDQDALFRQEWVRGLFTDAVATLRASCEASGKTTQFAVFQRYDLEDDDSVRPTYAQLATELAIPATQVTNYLAFARREFRRLVLERLRSLCATDEEFRFEARALLGVDSA